MSLSLNIGLTGSCCNGSNIVQPVSNGRDLIKITEADFYSAVLWNGKNNEGVLLRSRYSLKVFYNDGNRYLDEGTEWQRTSLGIEILIPGFDATADPFTFYIHINKA